MRRASTPHPGQEVPLSRLSMWHVVPLRLIVISLLGIQTASCAAQIPTVEEVNSAVLALHQYQTWAWALGIGSIWADLVLPVPQTSVIAALGIIYGVIGGGLLGSVGLITAGLLGYGLARAYGRRVVAVLVGEPALRRVEKLSDGSGIWAIVLTRSLPYSIPEVVVCLAGLSRMRLHTCLVALSLGSIPTAFVFAGVGAGWATEPLVALAISYGLPITLLPVALYLLRGRGGSPHQPPGDR
jgi:uncharacterized membrane protein YdjX (TVP38/TMEM64 family)